MEQAAQEKLIRLLHEELIAALGCTEPIAIAYGAALGRRVLGAMPERVVGHMSGNIIKNVKCVIVPNSGGRRGVDVAIALGLAGGNDSKKLEVISDITDSQRRLMEVTEEALAAKGIRYLFCTAHPENTYSQNNICSLGYEAFRQKEMYGGYRRDLFIKCI